jgi:ATP-dependent Clp protease ATP-binding subunit ClpA
MDSIVIYYGPKKGFDNYLKENNINQSEMTTLSYLIRKYDEENREYRLINTQEEKYEQKQKIEVEILVIYSDEYASVREHVIINFEGFIANFNIGNLYIQNPPEIVSKKILRIYENTETVKFEYNNLSEDNIYKINKMFDQKIIGQDSVKKQLLVSIFPLLKSYFNKPIVILFYGPSGVGKTETAKYLSEILGGELYRKQLSMFQNNDFVTYLFGGQHYEKSFAKDLLERETNVILLDEFDKASNIFHSAFYQLFDEGVFVDKNYDVKIGKSIIICTSNYLSLEEIRTHLGDPIFSRFDSCIKFNELNENNIKDIIKLRVDIEYNNLESDSQCLIDKDKIMSLFIKHIKSLKNARTIESLVRDVFSEILLDNLLGGEPPHAQT